MACFDFQHCSLPLTKINVNRTFRCDCQNGIYNDFYKCKYNWRRLKIWLIVWWTIWLRTIFQHVRCPTLIFQGKLIFIFKPQVFSLKNTNGLLYKPFLFFFLILKNVLHWHTFFRYVPDVERRLSTWWLSTFCKWASVSYGYLTKQYEVALSRMLHDNLEDDYIQWHPPLMRHNDYPNFWPFTDLDLITEFDFLHNCARFP